MAPITNSTKKYLSVYTITKKPSNTNAPPHTTLDRDIPTLAAIILPVQRIPDSPPNHAGTIHNRRSSIPPAPFILLPNLKTGAPKKPDSPQKRA